MVDYRRRQARVLVLDCCLMLLAVAALCVWARKELARQSAIYTESCQAEGLPRPGPKGALQARTTGAEPPQIWPDDGRVEWQRQFTARTSAGRRVNLGLTGLGPNGALQAQSTACCSMSARPIIHPEDNLLWCRKGQLLLCAFWNSLHKLWHTWTLTSHLGPCGARQVKVGNWEKIPNFLDC